MEPGMEELQRLRSDAEQRLKQYQRLRDEIAEMSGTAESPDKNVVVTVAPGGAVKDIHLTERAVRLGPTALSELLMQTIARASADVAQRMAERVSEIAPPQIDVMSVVRSRLPDLEPTAPDDRGDRRRP